MRSAPNISSKTSLEFYQELAKHIAENNSDKVLSELLTMGLAVADINKIVQGELGDGKTHEPLYLKATGNKGGTILELFDEFGVTLPAELKPAPPTPPTPAALKNKPRIAEQFAQHFLVRRSTLGKTILKSSPACAGLCYEYVRFHMTPHKKQEDFMDKILREIHEGVDASRIGADNFYYRVATYQDFSPKASTENRNVTQIRRDGVLSVYSEQLQNAELVSVTMMFGQGIWGAGHAMIIRKVPTKEGVRYQLFDLTRYRPELLTAEELNKQFEEHIKHYEKDWNWGPLNTVYLGDAGIMMHQMGHLVKTEDLHRPFKNMHIFLKAIKDGNIEKLKPLLSGYVMSDTSTIPLSPMKVIYEFLTMYDVSKVGQRKDFYMAIIDNLSANNLNVMATKLLAHRYRDAYDDLFKRMMEENNISKLDVGVREKIQQMYSTPALSPGQK